MAKFKRRQFIVDKKLQFSFMFTSFFYFVMTILVLGIALFMPLVMDLYGSTSNVAVLGEVADKILYLNTMFWPAVFFLVVLICCHTIYKTHKLAGPLYRFRVVMNRVIGGDLTANFKLRDGDYLYEEMDILNGLIDELRARVFDVKERQAALHRSVIGTMEEAAAGKPEAAMERLDIIKEQSELLDETLGYFKIEAESIRGKTPGGPEGT